MRFDKKFLGELRKTLPIAMRKFSRNFSVLWLEKFCRCQGIRALYGSKMIAKVFLQYINLAGVLRIKKTLREIFIGRSFICTKT